MLVNFPKAASFSFYVMSVFSFDFASAMWTDEVLSVLSALSFLY